MLEHDASLASAHLLMSILSSAANHHFTTTELHVKAWSRCIYYVGMILCYGLPSRK